MCEMAKCKLSELPPLEERLRLALLEDFGAQGDLTSQALVPARKEVRADVQVKADGVLCGVELAAQIFSLAARHTAQSERGRTTGVQTEARKKDGEHVRKGEVVARVSGGARAILAAERVALNLLCHLSGIATSTAQFVALVAHTRAKIVDTRKTTPLWRDLEKYAVRCGGGKNHRRGLYDMVLIKDNHLALWGTQDPAGAVCAVQKKFPGVPVQVEVTDLVGLQQVCKHSQPEMVLLDNFSTMELRLAVAWCERFFAFSSGAERRHSRPLLEASGGVSLRRVAAIAETGVDRISIGALTHSVEALDISLEFRA